MREDYYEILGASETANASELKAAYHRQAMRYHPDRNAGSAAAEERFKLVGEAWMVLGDAARRSEYDAWLQRRRSCPAGGRTELEGFRRSVRVSSRSGRERREERSPRRRVRGSRSVWTPPARRGFLPTLLRLGAYAMVLSMLLPLIVAVQSGGKRRESEEPQKVEAVQNALQLEERRRQYGDELLVKARAGDAQAQYAYAWFLYRGGRGEEHRSEALSWVQQAADNGLASARRLLESAYWEEQLSPEEVQDAESQDPAIPVDGSISLPVVGSDRETGAAGAEPSGTPEPDADLRRGGDGDGGASPARGEGECGPGDGGDVRGGACGGARGAAVGKRRRWSDARGGALKSALTLCQTRCGPQSLSPSPSAASGRGWVSLRRGLPLSLLRRLPRETALCRRCWRSWSSVWMSKRLNIEAALIRTAAASAMRAASCTILPMMVSYSSASRRRALRMVRLCRRSSRR